MPNGGSDCCGTCWFNATNRGQAGYGHADSATPPACEIRGNLPIEHPFYTYCSNHPHHNPDRVRIPVGPVYTINDDDHGRHVSVESPDSPEIRDTLLGLLAAATPSSARRYSAGLSLTEAAIRQLGEFRDERALPGLDSVRGFAVNLPPTAPDDDNDDPHEDVRRMEFIARRALKAIVPPEALTAYRTATTVALGNGYAATGDSTVRAVLADALEEAGCSHPAALRYLRTPIPPGSPCWVVDLVRGTEPPADAE